MLSLDENVSDLKCGQTLENQQNTEFSHVQYYKINITKLEHRKMPITISTCSHVEYDTFMYIVIHKISFAEKYFARLDVYKSKY